MGAVVGSDGFDVHPEQLREHGGKLQDLGSRATGELQAQQDGFSSGASSLGSSPGAAEFGQLYGRLTDLTSQLTKLVTDGIDTVGHNVRAMADNHESIDAAHKAKFDAISGGHE